MKRNEPERYMSRRKGVLAIVAAFVAVTLALGTSEVLAPSERAEAAGYGPGYDEGNGHLGAYSHGGYNVYCAEEAAARPVGTTTGPSYSTSWAGVSALNLARVNWAISTRGQSTDRRWTAAVSMYVWSIVDTASYNSHGMSGDSWFITRATSGDRAQIQANLASLRASAATITSVASSGSGSASLNVVMTDAYNGTVTVTTSPTNATGVLTLTGATIAGTPATSIPVSNGSVVAIDGAPLDEDNKYAITANATFTANDGKWKAETRLYSTGSAQKLMGPGRDAEISFSASTFVTDPIPLEFAPVVETTVTSKIIGVGEVFSDTVTFSSAEGFSPWRVAANGTYSTITAHGTVYGPFDQQPAESATVPVGAPIAGTATITTTDVDGPTVSYVATTTETATTAGFYTWVWTIVSGDQGILTQTMIPTDYEYADVFGRVAETHVSPMAITGVSQISSSAVELGGTVTDSLVVTQSGGVWLQDDSGNIPVVLRASAYFVAGDPSVALTPSADVPAGATLLSSETFEIADTDTLVTAGTQVPPSTLGHVTFQWCVNVDDQATELAGFVTPWCDEFGLANETAAVEGPTITTQAKADVVLWTTPASAAWDVAVIAGTIPAASMLIDFAAYYESYDVAGDPVCEAANQVWASSAPLVATAAGSYRSDSFIPEEVIPAGLLPAAGAETPLSVWFVETLRSSVDDATLAEGECGLDNETSLLHNPILSSEASHVKAQQGVLVHDMAFLTGSAPVGATIGFDAYLQEDAETPLCTADNLVWSSSAIPVVDGVDEYQSALVKDLPVGTIFWVEKLMSADAEVLREGVCGAALEVTTILDPPPLADTGSRMVGESLAGGVLALLVGGTFVFAARRRRQLEVDTVS